MTTRSSKYNTRIYVKKQRIARTEAHIAKLQSLLDNKDAELSRYQDQLRNLYIESHGFEYQSPLIVRQEFLDYMFSIRLGWHVYCNIDDVVFLTEIDENDLCQVSHEMFCYKGIPLAIVEKMRPVLPPPEDEADWLKEKDVDND